MSPKRSPVRVLVVDRQPLVRAGIRAALDGVDDLQVVAEAQGAVAGMWAARLHRPGLVVLGDLACADGEADAVAWLAERAPVMLLAEGADVRAMHEAFAAGVRGFLERTAEPAQLLEAMRVVVSGDRYVDPRVGGRLAQAAVDAARAGLDDPLTAREHQILRLIALGYTNQEMSTLAGISIRTVEAHRAHVLDKLGVVTRHELVAYALRGGLVSGQDVGVPEVGEPRSESPAVAAQRIPDEDGAPGRHSRRALRGHG